VEGEKTCAVVSTIREATLGNTGRTDTKTNLQIKKPYAVVQCNKFTKGIGRADRYLSYYSVLRKTVKWLKLVLYLVNCALFNGFFFVYRTLDTKFKSILHWVERSWVPKRPEYNRAQF
jgi:hypothetical protein